MGTSSSAATAAGLPVASSWRRVLFALLLIEFGTLLVYRDTVASMVGIWARSDTFAHAFTVLPITLWLIWRRREGLLSQGPQPTAWLILPMGAAALLWLLGELAAVNAATQVALMTLLVLAVPLTFGVGATRTILFPLGFLYFAVPIGEFLIPHMMLWTADFTVLALRLTGIPVYREGQQIVIPSGTWSVIEACSGVRYLIASVMIGTLFAYLNYRSLARRVAFVAVAIAVPIVANWLRAYLTVLLGHMTSNRLAAGADHLVYGWVFFGLVIMVMFAIGARWSDSSAAMNVAAATARAERGSVSSLCLVVACAMLITLVPHVALWSLTRDDAQGSPVLAPPPRLAGGWLESDRTFTDWRPAFMAAAAQIDRAYVRGNGDVLGLYVAYYRQQARKGKMVSSTNVIVSSEDKRWSLVDRGRRTFEVAGVPIDFRTARIRAVPRVGSVLDNGLVAWQFYWVDGKLIESDIEAKAYGALFRLLGRGDDAAVIVLYAPEGKGDGHGEAAIEAFLRANLGPLEAQLRAARDGTR